MAEGFELVGGVPTTWAPKLPTGKTDGVPHSFGPGVGTRAGRAARARRLRASAVAEGLMCADAGRVELEACLAADRSVLEGMRPELARAGFGSVEAGCLLNQMIGSPWCARLHNVEPLGLLGVPLTGAETPRSGTPGCSKLRETATRRTSHGGTPTSGTLGRDAGAGSCGKLLPAGTVITNRGEAELDNSDCAPTTGGGAARRDWDRGLLAVTGAVIDRAVSNGRGGDCAMTAGYGTGDGDPSTTGRVADGSDVEGCDWTAVLAALTGAGRLGSGGGGLATA